MEQTSSSIRFHSDRISKTNFGTAHRMQIENLSYTFFSRKIFNCEGFTAIGILILKSFSDANLLPTDLRLQIGEDILVMRYPLRKYYDDVFNLPILRNGTVAGAYPIPFKGQSYFLIDARLHKGTSGSPVITKSKYSSSRSDGRVTMSDGFQFFLLGVNSSTAQLPEDEELLGLNSAVFASFIQSITR
jgi:hypothetical protein